MIAQYGFMLMVWPMNNRPSESGPVGTCGYRALTLVEVMMSVVLVGGLLVATLNVVGSVFCTHRVAAEQQQAHDLGVSLLDEILQTRYHEPEDANNFGPEGGEDTLTRSDFDDVDDYHNWIASPPQGRDGLALPGHDNWERSVTVQWAEPVDPQQNVIVDKGLKRVIVTVRSPRGASYTQEGLRSGAGMLEYQAALPGTYTTAVEIVLQSTVQGPNTVLLGAVTNHAPDE